MSNKIAYLVLLVGTFYTIDKAVDAMDHLNYAQALRYSLISIWCATSQVLWRIMAEIEKKK